MLKIDKISTEQRNPETLKIDKVNTKKMLEMINNQDKQVALAVEKVIPQIAKAVDAAYEVIKNGGRVIYFGAGTSGRLGILDASEILPTYGEANWFIGLIAGGSKAIVSPVENAEDNREFIIEDFKSIKATKKDLFVGIAASGRTPYVLAGLEHANKIGATTVSISTSKDTAVSKVAKIAIEAVTGPETITGSTRMKSGTAQKMILNMISTGVAVKMGKTFSNFMVDMKATNEKLYVRAINMIRNIIDISPEDAEKLFIKSGKNVKVAIVMHSKNLSKINAQALLKKHDGLLVKVLAEK